MTAVPLGETPSLCVLCPPQRAKIARPGGMTDWGCHERIDEQLGEILQRYARLTARPDYRTHDFGRRAPGFHSRPPLKIQAASLRDPRTAPKELGEPHSPLNLFISWATWIRLQRRQRAEVVYPPGDDLAALDFEWRYLTNSLDWITRQTWVVQFAEQTRVVVSQLRSATGEPNPRPVGVCEKVVEGATGPRPCGHPLFPPREGREVVCGGCEARYDPMGSIRMMVRSKAGCRNCGHAGLQHSHDEVLRPCNVEWCGCTELLEVQA